MEQTIIEKVKAFIASHLEEEFSLSEIAQIVSYSAFHLSREFKEATGQSIMEYCRQQRIRAASEEIAHGHAIFEVAMKYCFDTHAGFTRAFTSVVGCTPSRYAEHKQESIQRGMKIMEDSKIVIRHICKDDVQDLWENVYSAMTPRQITEEKIIPAQEAYKNKEGLELVAQVNGKVVMALHMKKPFWLPIGYVFDNNYVLTGGIEDVTMKKMLEEMKRQSKMMGISTLVAPEYENSKSSEAFIALGFTKAFVSDGWDYLMLAL